MDTEDLERLERLMEALRESESRGVDPSCTDRLRFRDAYGAMMPVSRWIEPGGG